MGTVRLQGIEVAVVVVAAPVDGLVIIVGNCT